MNAALRLRLVAVLVAPALVVAGCGGHAVDASPASAAPTASSASAVSSKVIPVSVDGCGAGWTPGPAGEQRLELENVDHHAGEARIVSVEGGQPVDVYADVEPFGPGTERTVDVRLGAGAYAVECLMEDESPDLGPVVHITGSARGGPGVQPVDQNQVILATWQYQDWVLGRLPQLVRDTATMSAALARRDLGPARADWLQAHLDYETLGAAYDAFGDLEGQIDGLTNGLPKGVHDPGFTGFHRIELALFHGTPSARTYADLARRGHALAQAVGQLHHQLAGRQIDPLTVTIRAHEITENLLQFELDGEDDYGSHSDLQTLGAGLAGDAKVLSFLHALLVPRYAATASLERLLADTRARVAHDERSSWARRPVAAWPRAEREGLSAAVAELAERLAPVADVLEPRRDQ